MTTEVRKDPAQHFSEGSKLDQANGTPPLQNLARNDLVRDLSNHAFSHVSMPTTRKFCQGGPKTKDTERLEFESCPNFNACGIWRMSVRCDVSTFATRLAQALSWNLAKLTQPRV